MENNNNSNNNNNNNALGGGVFPESLPYKVKYKLIDSILFYSINNDLIFVLFMIRI